MQPSASRGAGRLCLCWFERRGLNCIPFIFLVSRDFKEVIFGTSFTYITFNEDRSVAGIESMHTACKRHVLYFQKQNCLTPLFSPPHEAMLVSQYRKWMLPCLGYTSNFASATGGGLPFLTSKYDESHKKPVLVPFNGYPIHLWVSELFLSPLSKYIKEAPACNSH